MSPLSHAIGGKISMNRIEKAFDRKKACIAFVTGGDPDLRTTEELILTAAASGADIVEVGIPFSDPVAGGIEIQEADERAIAAGCTTDKIFTMLQSVREKTDTAFIVVTYMNPVFRYGSERFIARCRESGVDGLMVPDLPFEEREEISAYCSAAGLHLISVISPSADDRVRRIAEASEGFMYCMMSPEDMADPIAAAAGMKALIGQIRSHSNIPCAVYTEDVSAATIQQIFNMADGVILGNALVRLVAQYGAEAVVPVQMCLTEIESL